MGFLHATKTVTISLNMLMLVNASTHAQILNRSDLEREIARYQAASAEAGSGNMPPLAEGRLWSHLGDLYQDAGRYRQSEQAFEHAMRLLTISPVSTRDLANTTDALGTLYMETGNLQQAERAETKAKRLREEAALKNDLPLSWYHLANLFLRKHQAAKAQSFAEHALAAFEADPLATPENKLGSRLVLASSFCQQHKYALAIEHLQSTLSVAREIYGAGSFPAGLSEFLLGYAQWKGGNPAAALQPMQQASALIGRELGTSHPAYLIVMENYTRLLRAEHRRDEANAIKSQVKEARARLNANPAYGHGLQTIDLAALF